MLLRHCFGMTTIQSVLCECDLKLLLKGYCHRIIGTKYMLLRYSSGMTAIQSVLCEYGSQLLFWNCC